MSEPTHVLKIPKQRTPTSGTTGPTPTKPPPILKPQPMLEALTTGLAQEITARTPDDTTAIAIAKEITDYISDVQYRIIVTRITDYRIKDIEILLEIQDTDLIISSLEWHRYFQYDLNEPDSIEHIINGTINDIMDDII